MNRLPTATRRQKAANPKGGCFFDGGGGRSFSPDEIQHLLDILLSKGGSLAIDGETGHAHYIVLIFNILKMANVIYMGRHIWIPRGNLLGRDHQIGTQGTGKRDQDLQIRFACDGRDLPQGRFIQRLPGSCRIV